ncbi:MAG: histidine phosphatase family protein [Bacteroidetes bacterium]|nr:histidine phosphatase family protein [Bacteroidota bacterium]
MKTLYLVRHAKSSWADPGMEDFDRPLNDRGLRDAPAMAERFKARHEPVDLLVSSPAARALATARCYAQALDLPVTEDKRIYEAHHRALQGVVESLPDTAQRVMLFGHNPGFSLLTEHLCEAGLGDLPTCAIVRIDLTVASWEEVAGGLGTLVWWDFPKSA